MDAPWWDNPEADDTPVIRHAPDKNNYHLPDENMIGKMRGSKVGQFAIIPSANKDGTSRGFDATVAGPVHVDPDAPDGGVIFDPNTVNKQAINQAISKSNYPHQVFYALGTPAPLLGFSKVKNNNQEPRINPHLPENAYLTPMANHDGSQKEVLQEQVVNNLQQSTNQPFQMPFPQQVQPPPPQQVDPMIASMMQSMLNLQQQVSSLLQQRNTIPQTTGMSQTPLPQGPPPVLATLPVELRDNDKDYNARPIRKRVVRNKETQEIEEEEEESTPKRRHKRNNNSLVEHDQAEREQTLEEYEDYIEKDKPRKGVIAGFETLNIPWVTGPVANKAKKQVFFEIPGAGKHSARYHDVLESEHCIILVYDTRYEDGTQYLPPDLGDEKLKLHCPMVKKTYTVSSMGFSFSFGVFDCVALVLHEKEVLDYEES